MQSYSDHIHICCYSALSGLNTHHCLNEKLSFVTLRGKMLTDEHQFKGHMRQKHWYFLLDKTNKRFRLTVKQDAERVVARIENSVEQKDGKKNDTTHVDILTYNLSKSLQIRLLLCIMAISRACLQHGTKRNRRYIQGIFHNIWINSEQPKGIHKCRDKLTIIQRLSTPNQI